MTTDEAGMHRLPLGDLARGRYELDIEYHGNLDTWPTRTTTIIRVS